MSLYNIIRRPLLTEKSTRQKDEHNEFSFEVNRNANKSQIKECVEKAFKVTVLRVNTINVLGKDKRVGRFVGKRPDWKKAIVTLKAGDKIEFFEGA